MTEKYSDKTTGQKTSQEMMQIGGLLVGGGLLGLFYLLIKRSRNILGWLISMGLIVGGLNLFVEERQKRIRETGDQIRAQLDELDPVARAQVVKYLADQEIEKGSR